MRCVLLSRSKASGRCFLPLLAVLCWVAAQPPTTQVVGWDSGLGENGIGPVVANEGRQPVTRTGAALVQDEQPPLAVSDQEAQQFATALLEAIEEQEVNGFNRLFAYTKMLDRAWQGIEVPADVQSSFNDGFLSTMVDQGQMARELIQMQASGGQIDLLHIRQREGTRTALFRLLLPNGGLNYHEFRLVKNQEGQVVAEDLHIMVSGEWLSQTVQRMCAAVAANAQQERLGSDAAAEEHLVQSEKLMKMSQALRQGYPWEALRLFEQLSPEFRKDKSILLLRLQAAIATEEDDQYLKSMEDLRQHHPDDPCQAMVLMDYYLMRGQFEEAMQGVDTIEKAIGGDAYCEVLRAGILLADEKPEQALEAARRAIKSDPQLRPGYWALINITNLQKNFDATVHWIKELSQYEVLEPDDFMEAPEMEELTRSPAFIQWRDSRKGGN